MPERKDRRAAFPLIRIEELHTDCRVTTPDQNRQFFYALVILIGKIISRNYIASTI